MTSEERQEILGAPPERRRLPIRLVTVLIVMACLLGVGNSVLNAILISGNAHTINEIQKSREDSIRSQCREQNARHDGTIATLDQVLQNIKRTDPAQYKQAQAGRDNTVLLIDSLTPKRDCELRVRQLVK